MYQHNEDVYDLGNYETTIPSDNQLAAWCLTPESPALDHQFDSTEPTGDPGVAFSKTPLATQTSPFHHIHSQGRYTGPGSRSYGLHPDSYQQPMTFQWESAVRSAMPPALDHVSFPHAYQGSYHRPDLENTGIKALLATPNDRDGKFTLSQSENVWCDRPRPQPYYENDESLTWGPDTDIPVTGTYPIGTDVVPSSSGIHQCNIGVPFSDLHQADYFSADLNSGQFSHDKTSDHPLTRPPDAGFAESAPTSGGVTQHSSSGTSSSVQGSRLNSRTGRPYEKRSYKPKAWNPPPSFTADGKLTYSCVTCHRRKTKCDKSYPCGFCSKSGEHCTKRKANKPGRPLDSRAGG